VALGLIDYKKQQEIIKAKRDKNSSYNHTINILICRPPSELGGLNKSEEGLF
jgi:hypothetical protein